jgi:RHS repeat-associated protein
VASLWLGVVMSVAQAPRRGFFRLSSDNHWATKSSKDSWPRRGVFSTRQRAERPCDQTHFVTHGLGSTTELADNDGDVVATYEYDAFGAIRSQSGSQPNEFRFTGKQWDDSTALEYLRARYYDPAIGRFLSQDPFRGLGMVPQSLNRYPYVLNNPLLYRDPYGYWPSLGDIVDKAKDVAGAAAEGVAADAQWLGEDYHWASVGAAVGGTAFAGGVVLLSGGTAAPLAAVLMSGGLGVGAPLTVLSVAHSGKECAGGDKGACVSAGVGGVSAPLGFAPGSTGVFFELLPVATDVGVSTWHALFGQSSRPKE